MLRLVVGLLGGLALGFGVGWVVFDDPFASDEPTQAEIDAKVEAEVARYAHTAHADCGQRQNPGNVWDCTADANENTVLPLPCLVFVATVSGEKVGVEKQRSDPFNEC